MNLTAEKAGLTISAWAREILLNAGGAIPAGTDGTRGLRPEDPPALMRKCLEMKQSGLTQEEIAKRVQKSQSYVAKLLGIALRVDDELRQNWSESWNTAVRIPIDGMLTLVGLPAEEQKAKYGHLFKKATLTKEHERDKKRLPRPRW